MTAKLGQYLFIEAPAPPPPPAPEVCERIATNQRAPLGFHLQPLEDVPGSGSWTGDDSTESGIHQQYEYEDLGDGSYRQWIVMKSVTGTFTAGEVLTPGAI